MNYVLDGHGVSQSEATPPSTPLASLPQIPFSFTNGWQTFKSYVGTSSFHVGDEQRSEGDIKSQKAHASPVATLMDFPPAEVKPTQTWEKLGHYDER
eukprot:scaffold59926_cov42-Attheya_sp.AAC.1